MNQKLRTWIATPAETRTAWIIASGCVALIIAVLLWPLKESARNKPQPESSPEIGRQETRLEAKQSSGSIEKLIEKVQREEPRKVRITPEPEVRPQPVRVAKPAPEAKKVVAAAPKKTVATTTPAALPKGYYVQLGAFSKRSGAESLQKKLATKLGNTHLKKKPNGMTAVWSGPYASKSEANSAQVDIAKRTGIKGYTVSN